MAEPILQINKQPNHFEPDTHEYLKGKEIDSFQMLKGAEPSNDILIVIYKDCPLLSFYDINGRLIDVDHYLPDNYVNHDIVGTESVISNLSNYDASEASKKASYRNFIKTIYAAGADDFIVGLREMYGLQLDYVSLAQSLDCTIIEAKTSNLSDKMIAKFFTFSELLDDLIINFQRSSNGYIHITANDNIVITPLNKRSGMSVIIETKDLNGNLLFPNKWNIVRTKTPNQLEQALVFRHQDIKDFFEGINYETTFTSDRYRLYHKTGELSIDSSLDNTDNLLKLNLINDCYQLLASDRNIIVALTNYQEITVINTHKSVIPQKWPRKIVFPFDIEWMVADENLSCVFVQSKSGEITAFDITGDHVSQIGIIGGYDYKFDLDQRGDLVVSHNNGQTIDKIKTNVYSLNLGAELDSYTSIFTDISHLFKGENIFTKTKYARPITELEVAPVEKLPTAIQSAKYDFETSIEHMLLNNGDSYEILLDVKNKIAIARQNISEELFKKAEAIGVILVGQRLKKAISSIVGPTERRISKMVNVARSEMIIGTVRELREGIQGQQDTDDYREMLNSFRKFDEELRIISNDVDSKILSEFKSVQLEMNALFADQVTDDSNKLNHFIKGEIELIEEAIDNTHDMRQLELILSTHPACLELMSLLKQPFVLQSVASGNRFSPAMIQSRLYKKIESRKQVLQRALEQKEAQKNAAKLQLAEMIKDSIVFFVKNHSGGFSDQELTSNASHEAIQRDIRKLEHNYNDIRLTQDLRRQLTRKILDRNRKDLEKLVAFEGRYAYIQNDPDLFVDMESNSVKLPMWEMQLSEKKDNPGIYLVSYVRSTDKQIHKISTDVNLLSGKSFEISEAEYIDFKPKYDYYISPEKDYHLLSAIWSIYVGQYKDSDYPQYTDHVINEALPKSKIGAKALRCALEKRIKEYEEKNRKRNVPKISNEFIDETPYFQDKLHEFIIKAKLQMLSGSGIILLSGPPSTGKSVFLKFAASIMNREYFEHTSDKWQTKNSLVTAIKFGEYGPYSIPAGFTKAITTANSLINIEEIKEWPEALRKSLNPFFAGSNIFTAPDGTQYDIGDNILLCAAANLGSMYRQDDEPFTADFWSRIEVVEYNYAPEIVDNQYFKDLINPKKKKLITTQDLVRERFNYFQAPDKAEEKARFFSRQFIEFTLLPKADEAIKRENLAGYINDYFLKKGKSSTEMYSPEEATKIAFKRIKDLRGYNVQEFFDMYDHFCNNTNLRSKRLNKMKTSDVDKYEQLKIIILMLRNIEGCLRLLRELFHSSAGQTEIEGTNREFIKCVHLLSLMGEM